jgi:uncharacterized protein
MQMSISPEVLYTLAVIMMLIGVAGTFLPALPGVPLTFAGMLLFAYAGNFEKIGTFTIVVLAVLTVIAVALDFIASLIGTKGAGASKWAMLGAALGTLAGLFFGLPGLVIGPFIGAVAGELIANKDFEQATKAGLGAWIGLVLGMAAKVAVTATMFGVLVTAWFVQ